MGFKVNHSEANQQNNIKPEGDYECLVQSINERTTRNGATGLNVSMVVRNDLNQNYKNAYIFYTLWKRREPTPSDLQVNGYGFGQVMALSKAAGLPDGKEYDDLKQLCEELTGKPIRVTLKHREYNGKTQEDVSWLNPTKFPEVKHTFKQSQSSSMSEPYAQPQQSYATVSTTSQNLIETLLDNDDLPF